MRPDILIFFIIAFAILVYSPIGKVLADILKAAFLADQTNSEITELKKKYERLESKVNEYENELIRVRESIIYYDEKLQIHPSEETETMKKISEAKKKELS